MSAYRQENRLKVKILRLTLVVHKSPSRRHSHYTGSQHPDKWRNKRAQNGRLNRILNKISIPFVRHLLTFTETDNTIKHSRNYFRGRFEICPRVDIVVLCGCNIALVAAELPLLGSCRWLYISCSVPFKIFRLYPKKQVCCNVRDVQIKE